MVLLGTTLAESPRAAGLVLDPDRQSRELRRFGALALEACPARCASTATRWGIASRITEFTETVAEYERRKNGGSFRRVHHVQGHGGRQKTQAFGRAAVWERRMGSIGLLSPGRLRVFLRALGACRVATVRRPGNDGRITWGGLNSVTSVIREAMSWRLKAQAVSRDQAARPAVSVCKAPGVGFANFTIPANFAGAAANAYFINSCGGMRP